MDTVFNPILGYVSDEYAKDADEEMHKTYDPVIESLADNYALIEEVIDVKESDDYKNGSFTGFVTDDSEFTLEEGKEPAVAGSLKKACQISDALVLQYYEETDKEKAAFGHSLSDEDWENISEIKDVYVDALFSTPIVAENVAYPLLQEIEKELQTKGSKELFLSMFLLTECFLHQGEPVPTFKGKQDAASLHAVVESLDIVTWLNINNIDIRVGRRRPIIRYLISLKYKKEVI